MPLTKPPAFTFNHVDQVDKLEQAPAVTKEAFDSRAKQIRDYLNDTLTFEMDTAIAEAESNANDYTDTEVADLAGAGRTTETVKGNADSLTNLNTTVNNHLADTMPHKFVDGETTYRWGLSVVGGVLMFNYEEVV